MALIPLTNKPILYSYRRCPYAMRARMALAYAGIPVEIREISLKEKPPSMVAISPKATVPVMQHGNLVLEQSLDIMRWALSQHDPDGWLTDENTVDVNTLIDANDSSFKKILDQYKYPSRFPELNPVDVLTSALNQHLRPLNDRLMKTQFLLGAKLSMADVAIFPFIRQFHMVDETLFSLYQLEPLKKWLNDRMESDLFLSIMQKHPVWQDASLEKL
ncbi:MAG: glutathione S-transferase N-terminal domain-containing protein [Polynucleobacter victoriensis]